MPHAVDGSMYTILCIRPDIIWLFDSKATQDLFKASTEEDHPYLHGTSGFVLCSFGGSMFDKF